VPAPPARRAAVAAATTAAAALAVHAGWVEPRRLVVRDVEPRLPHWPDRLDGLRVGVFSDLHAGVPHVGLATVRRVVDAVNERRPDLHLLLGDHLDASQVLKRRLTPDAVAAELGRLRAPLGTISVIGNHDWRNSGDRMWRALSRAGVTVLEDAAVELVAPDGGSFWVAGLADLRHRRPDLGLALSAVPADAPVLLLSHHPDVFPGVPARVALTLSGHTHGGQVAVPLLRRPMVPSRYGERYVRGHVVEGGRHLLVTSGVGTSGLPVRLLAPPEALVLTLRAAR
jgi:predicted MPP superfamily phosphohydrolase